MSNNTGSPSDEHKTAKVMLPIIHNLRTHWSTVITTHIGYAVTIVTGIWAFFGKAYIDCESPRYLFAATGLSSVFLILWRIYAHYLDNQLASLYPELIFYESILKVPHDKGISEYLKQIPHIDNILKEDLTPSEKSQAISELVKNKLIGNRGHKVIDIMSFAMIILMIGVCTVAYVKQFAGYFACGNKCLSICPINCLLVCLKMTGSSLILIVFILCTISAAILIYYISQKNPSKNTVEQILAKFKSKQERQTTNAIQNKIEQPENHK